MKSDAGAALSFLWLAIVLATPVPAHQLSTLSGAVTSRDGRGLAGVKVVVSSELLGERHELTTDDQGLFEFAQLSAGAYTIRASKAGFLSMVYGARLPTLDVGLPIELSPGQDVKISLSLYREAAIEGTILSTSGNPLAGSRIGVFGSRYSRNELTVNTTSRPAGPIAITDALGRFRVSGLAPGFYIVVALAAVEAPLKDVASAAATNRSRTTAVPTYYPGTGRLSEAGQIELTEGMTMAIGSFVGGAAEATSVGVEIHGGGERSGQLFEVTVVPESMPKAVREFAGLARMRRYVGRRFEIQPLTPGDYVIAVRTPQRPGGNPTMTSDRTGRSDAALEGTRWGITRVRVSGEAFIEVPVHLDTGQRAVGRVVGSTMAATPELLLGMQRESDEGLLPPVAPARSTSDGTFVFENIAPGRYRFILLETVASPVGRTVLGAAFLQGRELPDRVVDVRQGQDIAGVTLSLADTATGISGFIRDRAGKPYRDAFVVVFPTNSERWLPGSFWIPRPTRPSREGRFEFKDLITGDYFVAAVIGVDPVNWFDKQTLEDLAAGSTLRVTVEKAVTKTVELQVR